MEWGIHSGKKKPGHITASQTCKIWKKNKKERTEKVKHPYLRLLVCMPKKKKKRIVKELQRSFEMRELLEQEEFWINQDKPV